MNEFVQMTTDYIKENPWLCVGLVFIQMWFLIIIFAILDDEK